MKNSNTGMVLAPNPADIISRQLKLDRNTFLQAVNLYNSLTQLDQSATVAAPNEGGEEDTGKRGPGRPKGSVAKRKTVKGGATASRRGRKAKNPNGMTMRDAVTNALRNANGPVKAPAIAETLKGQGFTSKSLNTQVAQELSRMVTDGLASRPERGSYAWSGSNAPAEQTAEVAQTA